MRVLGASLHRAVHWRRTVLLNWRRTVLGTYAARCWGTYAARCSWTDAAPCLELTRQGAGARTPQGALEL